MLFKNYQTCQSRVFCCTAITSARARNLKFGVHRNCEIALKYYEFLSMYEDHYKTIYSPFSLFSINDFTDWR